MSLNTHEQHAWEMWLAQTLLTLYWFAAGNISVKSLYLQQTHIVWGYSYSHRCQIRQHWIWPCFIWKQKKVYIALETIWQEKTRLWIYTIFWITFLTFTTWVSQWLLRDVNDSLWYFKLVQLIPWRKFILLAVKVIMLLGISCVLKNGTPRTPEILVMWSQWPTSIVT